MVAQRLCRLFVAMRDRVVEDDGDGTPMEAKKDHLRHQGGAEEHGPGAEALVVTNAQSVFACIAVVDFSYEPHRCHN